MESLNTFFTHKLYGAAALLPNISFNKVKSIKEVKAINWISLKDCDGYLRNSGVWDAGLNNLPSNINESLFRLFGYIE